MRLPLADRVGFEPTSRSRDYLISSQGRYDHFDTGPYNFLCFHTAFILYMTLSILSSPFSNFSEAKIANEFPKEIPPRKSPRNPHQSRNHFGNSRQTDTHRPYDSKATAVSSAKFGMLYSTNTSSMPFAVAYAETLPR